VTITELIEMLNNVPETLKDREIVLMDTSRGSKSHIRTDVSQLGLENGNVIIYTEAK